MSILVGAIAFLRIQMCNVYLSQSLPNATIAPNFPGSPYNFSHVKFPVLHVN